MHVINLTKSHNSPVFGPCTWTVFETLNKCYAHNNSLFPVIAFIVLTVSGKKEEMSPSSVLTRFLFVLNTHI